MTQVPIVRLDASGVEALVGATAFARLRAKARGGFNNFKGSRFEQFFGAHRVARLGQKFLADGSDSIVEWQSDAFIDDLVVRSDESRSFKGYQLKNAAQVSWTADDGAIAGDFANQHLLCQREGYTDIRLRLVCSHEDLAIELQEAVPEPISPFSRAIFFPYQEPLLPLLVPKRMSFDRTCEVFSAQLRWPEQC